MGIVASGFRRLFGAEPQKIVMLGLDAAGKTTILYKLQLGEVVTTIPTIGTNIESVQYKNICFTCMDVGGRSPIRPLVRHFYQKASGLIFVVDTNDKERMEQTADELNRALDEESLSAVPVLIFANKADLPDALSTAEVAQRLGVHDWRQRAWHIQSSVATTGAGLYEGLDWLTATLKGKNMEQSKTQAVQTPVAPEVLRVNKSVPKGGASDTESTADTERSDL
jgi:small GTP-binding protein